MPPRTWPERVTDIIESAEHIIELTRGSDFSAFGADRTLREAVLYNIVIIGEAARYVPAEVQARHPDVDWRGLRDMRNWVAHVYHAVSHRRVWKTITTDFPVLIPRLRQILIDEAGVSPPADDENG
jgi:uncharacterized protein with HEPN domain